MELKKKLTEALKTEEPEEGDTISTINSDSKFSSAFKKNHDPVSNMYIVFIYLILLVLN